MGGDGERAQGIGFLPWKGPKIIIGGKVGLNNFKPGIRIGGFIGSGRFQVNFNWQFQNHSRWDLGELERKGLNLTPNFLEGSKLVPKGGHFFPELELEGN